MNAIHQLCLNCGLCCDSTLFADVELRPGDGVSRLVKSGFTVQKKGRRKLAFPQPCVCFDGKYCNVYRNRPAQCRLFECGLLKKVMTGKMKIQTALNTISEAKTLANSVRGLLRAFGQHPDKQALSRCYSEAMSSPIDLSRPGNVMIRHDDLMNAFGRLMKLLETEFLQ